MSQQRKNLNLNQVQTIQVEPTSHCNSSCPHCPRFNFYDQGFSDGTLLPELKLTHMDIKILENLEINDLQNLKSVILEGDKGDPLMHPDIMFICEKFCEAPSMPHVSMITNGSIRSSKWWSNLASKDFKNLQVTFSIDGLEDTNHLYRIGLDYNKVISNAQSFIESGGYAIWKCIVFKHNIHQIEKIKELSNKLGFAELILVESDKTRYKGDDKWLVKNHDTTYNLEWVPYVDTRIKFSDKRVRKQPTRINYQFLCPNRDAGLFYISHQNYLIPCCMMHGDTQKDYPGKAQLELLTEGFDKIDLSRNKLSDILNTNFYKKNLEASLETSNIHMTCEKSCSHIIRNKITERLNVNQ